MNKGSETNASEAPRSPRPLGTGIGCTAVRAMLEVGARHLTDEALAELADHLDVCAACRAKFDATCPEDSGGGVFGEVTEPAPSIDLASRLVNDVLDYVGRHREQTQTLMLVHRRSFDQGVGQLAHDQVLCGRSYRFIVGERMGFDDFTETYAAERVLADPEEQGNRGVRAVIKIPRIAEDMSPDAADTRLGELRAVVRVHAQVLQNLSGLRDVAGVVDCGDYIHRLSDRSADSTFVAYEYIDGLDLASYMVKHCSAGGQFSGLPNAVDFAHWARMLTKGLLEIHNRLALHGDICPRNVLVTHEGRPVFIDMGQSLFREVMNGAKAFSGSFYRAPEGIGTPSSDLFSLGGVLYFLATGKQPIGFAHSDKEALKQQIAFKIKEANSQLYQDDAGVADIIAMCLRRDDRVQHARQVLRDIDTFWPEVTSASIRDELKSLTDAGATLDARGCSVYLSAARVQIRYLHWLFTQMTKGVLDANGSASDIRSAAYALLSTLGAGDQFVTVSLPAFWYPDNIGINGRFLSMCRNAAARGASIKRVFLIDDLSDKYLQQIVAAQLDAVVDIDPSLRPNFAVRYVRMSSEELRQYIANGKHFGLLVKGGERIAMSPVYDTNNALVSLRFRSGLREVEGLQETFKTIWSTAKPLVDLRLPTTSLNLDVVEKSG
jgi:serine/threonine protein kinase